MTGAVEALPSSTQFSGVHADLSGLGADDHLQYALLAGRALGQELNGGTAAGEILGLQGSAHADRGRVFVRGGMNIDWDFLNDAVTNGGLNFQNTIPLSGGLISSNVFLANTIGINNPLFIMSALDDASLLTWSVNPGFAVTTLFFARQQYLSTSAGVAPAQAYNYAAQCSYTITGAGSVAVSNYRALSFAPIYRANSPGDVLTVSNTTGLSVTPLWNVPNAGATVDFGNLRGLHMVNPAQVLFGSSAGTRRAQNVIGLDYNNINISTIGIRAVVRSALVSNAINYLILNTGGAESDFGAGDIHLNDSTWLKMGNTLTAPDMIVGWSPTQQALAFSTFFGVGGSPLYLRGTAQDTWSFQHDTGGANDIGLGFNVNAVSFGPIDPLPNSNNWFVLFSGPNMREVQIAGEYSDVLWSASGSINVAGNTVSDLQAFKINSPSIILNGGTIDDISNLFVQAMPSFGATRTQALRVLGRSRLDGHINQGSQEPAQITADQNNYQLAANNGQRGVALLDSDDDWILTGLDSSFGFGQGGDIIKLINVGSFNLTLAHENASSLASNRFLRANALDLVIAPGDTAEIWKDDTATDRWRILEKISTGGGLLTGEWKFDTATAAADPGAGQLRYDNATPGSVTNVYVDRFTDVNGDAQNLLSALANGDQLYIQQQGSAADFLVFDITSVTDNTGWFTIAGTVNASGGLPGNNRVLNVSARFA